MNVVSPTTPLQEIVKLMKEDGYVLMQNALAPEQLSNIQQVYSRQLELHPPQVDDLRIEVKRILEQDPEFEQLMDLPAVFSVARAMIGADIELASGGELDYKLPHTPAYIGWHNDFAWMVDVPYPRQNFWIRTTYFISDVTSDMGPFTLIPKTHLATQRCPSEYTVNGVPREIEGMIGITGPAGSCLINNTEIWHTNTPNVSDYGRELIMILYKHAWMKQWQDGYDISLEFTERQTDPLRRQLCGCYEWHRGRSTFPAAKYFDGEAQKSQ